MGERERSIWNKGKINNTVKEHSAIIAKKYKKVRKKKKIWSIFLAEQE
jgi:hypothetical protein